MWKDIKIEPPPKNYPSYLLVCHNSQRWLRFGIRFPGQNNWYYSATNERTQYSPVKGEDPTHWDYVPDLPSYPKDSI